MELQFSEEECDMLRRLLKNALSETRVAVRRAEVASFRETAKHEEAVLKSLIQRFVAADAA